MTEPRPAPYPADTRAKGWRFELDYERIEQSDTWDIAAEIPWAQHALMMMWYVAWKQTPCGSFPNDESTIRVKCKVPLKAWAQMRDVLLRGWWPGDDGRLYHDTIVARVLEMLEYRRKEAARRAGNRGKPPGVPRDNHGTPEGEHTDDTGSPDTGTGTGTIPSSPKKEGAPRRTPPPGRPDGVSDRVWADWLSLRTKKRAPVTETVIEEALRESIKADMTLEQFLRIWCMRGSQGLCADWIKPAERAAVAGNGKHNGFSQKDYQKGVNADGSLA